MSAFLAKIELAISSHRLIPEGESVLISVSGGVDSMVLLRTVALLAKQNRWKLGVVHFNHQLRGRGSDADERFVRKTAEMLEIPFYGGAGDVKQTAKEMGESVEMAARRLRHAFFAATARKLEIGRIALGHHADDKVELFFLRLLRGSGPEGLSALQWMDPSPANPAIRLVRPLLAVDRMAILDFARSERIKFREDATNAQCDFQRNRIRHKLLPFIRANIQPEVNSVIKRVIDILHTENDYVRSKTLEGAGNGGFDLWHPAEQRQFLLREFRALGIRPQFDLIERLRLAGGMVCSIGPDQSIYRDAKGHVHVEKAEQLAFDPECLEIDLSASREATMFDGVEFRWRKVGVPKNYFQQNGCERFDIQKLGAKILLRHWKPGDRFQPTGFEKSAKLQDLFVNQKIGPTLRRKLILAENNRGEIFWVEGLRMGELFKLDKNTEYALEWNWRRQ